MKAEELRTVAATNVTPFKEDLEIDFEALGRNLDLLADHGVKVVITCGNSGEFFSLTAGEAKEVTGFAARRIGTRTAVVTGIGWDARTAADLARHAAEQGCAGVMVHHPVNPFISDQGYVEYIRGICGAVSIGVIPYVRYPNISDRALLETVRLPGVTGVKFAINDVERFRSLVAASRDVDVTWSCGTAEVWAPSFFEAGATGYTSGLVNVAPKLTLEYLAALQEGRADEVGRLLALLRPFEQLRARNQSEHNVAVLKEALHRLEVAPRHVRPPCSTLGEADRAEVSRILGTWKGWTVQRAP